MLLRRYHGKAATAEPAEVHETPAGNAGRDAWEAYALTQGRTADELDGMTRNEIRDLFA